LDFVSFDVRIIAKLQICMPYNKIFKKNLYLLFLVVSRMDLTKI